MTDSNAVTKRSPTAARILIADDDPNDRHRLRDTLVELGFDVVAEASTSRQTIDLADRLQPDLVIVDAEMDQQDEFGASSAILERDVAPIILVGDPDSSLAAVDGDIKIAGYLPKTAYEASMLPAIEVALARHADIRKLRVRAAELEDALETRKVVERAKGILMDLHGLSEADAFSRMRKTSMDNRKTMREVAEAILLSHDLQLGSDLI